MPYYNKLNDLVRLIPASDYEIVGNVLKKAIKEKTPVRRRMIACAHAALHLLAEMGKPYRVYCHGGSTLRAVTAIGINGSDKLEITIFDEDRRSPRVPTIYRKEAGLRYEFCPIKSGSQMSDLSAYEYITPEMAEDLLKISLGMKVPRYDINGSADGFVGETEGTIEVPEGMRMTDGTLSGEISSKVGAKGKIWTAYYSARKVHGKTLTSDSSAAVPDGFRVYVTKTGGAEYTPRKFRDTKDNSAQFMAKKYIIDGYEKAVRNTILRVNIPAVEEAAKHPDKTSEPVYDLNGRIADLQARYYAACLSAADDSAFAGLWERLEDSVRCYLGNPYSEPKDYNIIGKDGLLTVTVPAGTINASAVSQLMGYGTARLDSRDNILSALKTIMRHKGEVSSMPGDDGEPAVPFTLIPDSYLYADSTLGAAEKTNSDDDDGKLSDFDNDEQRFDEGQGDKYKMFSDDILRSCIVFDKSSARDITPGSAGYDGLSPFMKNISDTIRDSLITSGVYENAPADCPALKIELDDMGIIRYTGTRHFGMNAGIKSGPKEVCGYIGQIFEPISAENAGCRIITDRDGDRIAVPSLKTGLIRTNYAYGVNKYIAARYTAYVKIPEDETDDSSFVNRTVLTGMMEHIVNALRSCISAAVMFGNDMNSETGLNSIYKRLYSSSLPTDFEDEAGKQDFELERLYENYDGERAKLLAGRGRLLYDRELIAQTSILAEGNEASDGAAEAEEPENSTQPEPDDDDDDIGEEAFSEADGDEDTNENTEAQENEPDEKITASPFTALELIRGNTGRNDHTYAPSEEASLAVLPDGGRDGDYVWRIELFDSRATGTSDNQGAVRYFNPEFVNIRSDGTAAVDFDKCRRIAAKMTEILKFGDDDTYGGDCEERYNAVNAMLAAKLSEYKKPLIIGENGAPACPVNEIADRYDMLYRLYRITFSREELAQITDINGLNRALSIKVKDAVAREAGECALLGLPDMYAINEYNPANRIVMSLSNKSSMLHTAFGRKEYSVGGKTVRLTKKLGVGTACVSCGGWTQDDAVVISREFAEQNRVKDTSGKYRPYGIGDKLCDCSGNKGVVSIVVDRNADTDSAYFRDPAHESYKRLVELFHDNPTLDVVCAPYSMTSRSNGGTARAMMRSIEAARRVEKAEGLAEGALTSLKINGCEITDGIGYITWTVTDKNADVKTKIYDARKGEGRSLSPQMMWAIDGLGAALFKSMVFAGNGGNFRRGKEILRTIGMKLNGAGELVPGDTPIKTGVKKEAGQEAQYTCSEPKIFDLGKAYDDRAMKYLRDEAGAVTFATDEKGRYRIAFEPEEWDDEYVSEHLLGKDGTLLRLSSPSDPYNAKTNEILFEQLLDADSAYDSVRLPVPVFGISDVMPVLSGRYRSVYETSGGVTLIHEYTRDYLRLFRASGRYKACEHRRLQAAEVCTAAYMREYRDRNGGTAGQLSEICAGVFSAILNDMRIIEKSLKDNSNIFAEMYEKVAAEYANSARFSEIILMDGKKTARRSVSDAIVLCCCAVIDGSLVFSDGSCCDISYDTDSVVTLGSVQLRTPAQTGRIQRCELIREGLRKINYFHSNTVKSGHYTLNNWIALYLKYGGEMDRFAAKIIKTARGIQKRLINDFIGSKDNIFKNLFEKTTSRGGATSIISPDPTLPLDRVRMPRTLAESIGLVSADMPFTHISELSGRNKLSVLIWRDPVLSDGGVRYPYADIVETREGYDGYDPDDPMNTLVGTAINPCSVKSMEGDFDGDTIGVYAPRSDEEKRSLDRHCRHFMNALNTETVRPDRYTVTRENGIFSCTVQPEPYGAYFTQELDVASGLDISGCEKTAVTGHTETAAALREKKDSLISAMNEQYLEYTAAASGKTEYITGQTFSTSSDEEEPHYTGGEAKTCRDIDTILEDMRETFAAFSDVILSAQLNAFGCDALSFASPQALFNTMLPQTLNGAKGKPEKLKQAAKWFGAELEYSEHDGAVTVTDRYRSLADDEDKMAAYCATSMKDTDTGIVGRPAQLAVLSSRNYGDEQIAERIAAAVQERHPKFEGKQSELRAAYIRELPWLLDDMRDNGRYISSATAITHQITQSIMGLKKLSREEILPKQKRYAELAPILLNGRRICRSEDGEWDNVPPNDMECEMTSKEWCDTVMDFFEDRDGLDIGLPSPEALLTYAECIGRGDCGYVDGAHYELTSGGNSARLTVRIPESASTVDILCYMPLKGRMLAAVNGIDLGNILNFKRFIVDRGENGVISNTLFGGAVSSLLLPAKERELLARSEFDAAADISESYELDLAGESTDKEPDGAYLRKLGTGSDLL